MAVMPATRVESGQIDPAPSDGLMKAIVQDKYGEPDAVLGLEDIAKPLVKDGEVLVRVHAASVHVGDWMMVTGVPYIARPAYGLPKPKNRVPGTDVAGTVEAVGKGVTELRPGDEVFGWCTGRLCRIRVRRGRSLPGQAGQPHVRAGSGGRRVGIHCTTASSRSRESSGRSEGLDQRCLRRRRNVRGADRQSVRRRGDRRVQHEEREHGPIDRR